MNTASELMSILALPLLACVILTGIHCYLGLHVLMREVIFVDLALAQVAALGAAVGATVGLAVDSTANYFAALGFTLAGAALFAVGRFKDRRVPQEAVIGIVYAVCSAAAILVLSKSATERDEIEHMLTGRLLFVSWHDIIKTASIYSGVAIVHALFRRRFFALSRAEGLDGPADRFWDFLFYATFGVVVTSSVKLAGVLLVFSYLIIPAACAMLFFRTLATRLLAGWGFGLAGSLGGLVAAALWDFPVGPAVVAVFGAMFLACSVAYALGLGARRTT